MDTALQTVSSGDRRISALCATACAGLAVAAPVAVVGLWSFASWDLLALVRLIPPDILPDMGRRVAPWQRVVGAGVCLVPVLLLSYGLLRVRRSLTAFTRTDFFAAEVVQGLRAYAGYMFWAAAAGLLSVPVLSVALSWANAPGHKELSFDLSGAQLLNLLAGGILWVIASAMAKASVIARENEQFV